MKSFTVYSDISFGSHGLTMDLYVPENAKTPMPCAVFFFGGGFRSGCKKDISFFPLLTDALADAGFCVAAPNYRLVTNGCRFPAPVEDALEAMCFLDSQTVVPVDKNRKAAFGLSSGGYLALMTALFPTATSCVKTVLGMSVPTYFKGEGAYGDIPRSDLLQDIADGYTDGQKEANLCNLISPARSKPRVMLVHGQEDNIVGVEFARRYVEDLRKNGFDVTYLEAERASHFLKSAFHDYTVPDGKELYRRMSDFIITNT